MKTDRKILVAFLLNLFFSVFEFVGGAFTGSVAIISDSLHDMGDAAGIGLSYFFERKSKKAPDDTYTYGYLRYSVLGSLMITVILLFGSVLVIYKAAIRLLNPEPVNYNGMIVFAVIGTAVNFSAVLFTRDGDSLNRKAVNLHMLEDTLGWIVVLAGAVIMRFTELTFIDPLMSIGVAVFILINSCKNLREGVSVFLERAPDGVSVEEIREHIISLDEVADVHHIHLWTMDGYSNCVTMHVVTDGDFFAVKEKIRHELSHHGITHSVIETETTDEMCEQQHCEVSSAEAEHHHHHH
ncbi:MAG: cation transporter, partial [Clostridia bacterium]|nr:cation transporter [Clostridia bacterium]